MRTSWKASPVSGFQSEMATSAAKQTAIAQYSYACTYSLFMRIPSMLVQKGDVCSMTIWITSGMKREPICQRAKPSCPRPTRAKREYFISCGNSAKGLIPRILSRMLYAVKLNRFRHKVKSRIENPCQPTFLNAKTDMHPHRDYTFINSIASGRLSPPPTRLYLSIFFTFPDIDEN